MEFIRTTFIKNLIFLSLFAFLTSFKAFAVCEQERHAVAHYTEISNTVTGLTYTSMLGCLINPVAVVPFAGFLICSGFANSDAVMAQNRYVSCMQNHYNLAFDEEIHTAISSSHLQEQEVVTRFASEGYDLLDPLIRNEIGTAIGQIRRQLANEIDEINRRRDAQLRDIRY